MYEPVDVSASALEGSKRRIAREIPGSYRGSPRDGLYAMATISRFDLGPMDEDELRLVLYIGSSIGNFEPHQAARLLRRVRAGLEVGDALLLGVDLVKDEATLLAAYDDAQGVRGFNRNVLVRLNRELDANFERWGVGFVRLRRGAPKFASRIWTLTWVA